MGESREKGHLTILRRIFFYIRKVCNLEKAIDGVTDSREQPRIKTRVVVRSVIVMFLARLGSLNALEPSKSSRALSAWVGAKPPSADSLGRIAALLNHDQLRQVNHELYTRLKRNKALEAPKHGLIALCVDGHESHATYLRTCPDCLTRTVHTANGERIQYYHRHVTAQLICGGLKLLLDSEPQRPNEDEVATALRLLERVFEHYIRAFDIVIADALYTDPRFFDFVFSRGKHVLTVLKNESRDLIKDARALFDGSEPQTFHRGKRECQCWDVDGFTTWPQVSAPVRVVRSVETWTIKRQLDGDPEKLATEWLWVTSLPVELANTRVVVDIGHDRWGIENEGFNELVTRWYADHVYKHDGSAMLSFLLLCMIAFNVFHAFYLRNLKPDFRKKHSMLHVARLISSCLYSEIPSRNPP